MTLVITPAILLRSHPYSETSRILRFLTPEHGIVAVVGKGVRRTGARGGGAPETFQEGTLTLSHRAGRDLHTLTDFQASRPRLSLGRDIRRFVGASLLAELLLAHSLEAGDPELYGWVRDALGRLSGEDEGEVPATILASAWWILVHFGFGPELEWCVRCGGPLGEGGDEGAAHPRFDAGAGGLRCPGCGGRGPRIGPRARQDVRALVRGEAPRDLRGARVHARILEDYALHHLAGRRPFRSFSMLVPLLEEG